MSLPLLGVISFCAAAALAGIVFMACGHFWVGLAHFAIVALPLLCLLDKD